MNAVKHTAGPWHVEDLGDGEFDIIGRPTWPCRRDGVEGEWRVAQLDDLEFDEPSAKGESKANAHLIAAAPELLAALRYALRFLSPEDHDVQFVVDAISKAEGRA